MSSRQSGGHCAGASSLKAGGNSAAMKLSLPSAAKKSSGLLPVSRSGHTYGWALTAHQQVFTK